jgi:predicted metalloprotease
VGGGGIGLVVLIIALLTGGDPGALLGGGDGSGEPGPSGGALEQCETGADLDTNAECRFVFVENSVQNFWEEEFASYGDTYTPAEFNVFSGQVSTGCGTASSQVGPFYCPPDEGVYLDIEFFKILENQLGAQGGDFAEAYVVAHEYGHHVQNLTGQMNKVRTQEGRNSDGVRLELQADCYAGMWAHYATTTPGDDGEPLITEVSEDDVAEAIDAAESVGDDYIQERMEGTVTPETWTHGSSSQRHSWFVRGMRSGKRNACDTFDAREL